MFKWIKKMFHNYLIKVVKSAGLSNADIDEKNRTINFGLFGLGKTFFEGKHHLALHILMKRYGYKCFQQRPVFNLLGKDVIF